MLCKSKNVLNKALSEIEVYSSKKISAKAKADPNIVGLSFGEPEFGPPEYLLSSIEEYELTIPSLLDSLKKYETPKGSEQLREAIADWYKNRYNLEVNPEKEIMITHGGVEAITLAILCVSELGDNIAITDPSYMLYSRAARTLGRVPVSLERPPAKYEYAAFFENGSQQQKLLENSKALIINSPENPSGYVVHEDEWKMIENYAERSGLWIIHDEVYDTMAFERKHTPYRKDHSILINSFSKKFGIPGIRIGWMIADEDVINLASKIHDYLYLGINILNEKIATRIISDYRNEIWLKERSSVLHDRALNAMCRLTKEDGFDWLRKPYGSMFLFPNVSELYRRIPETYKKSEITPGDAVAKYLMEERQVAVVPGSVYGKASSEYIRLVLCTSEEQYNLGIDRLKHSI